MGPCVYRLLLRRVDRDQFRQQSFLDGDAFIYLYFAAHDMMLRFGQARVVRNTRSSRPLRAADLRRKQQQTHKHPTRRTNTNLYKPPAMQDFDGREVSPMPVVQPYGILATLTHVKRQNGQDLNTFPIDSEKVTIGR